MDLDPNKPVMFLDFDGVLNGGFFHEFSHYYRPDMRRYFKASRVSGDYVLGDLADTFMTMCRATETQIVIVSSWMRPYTPADAPIMEKLKLFFNYNNFMGCAKTGGGVERGESVNNIIIEHELTHWVIVDDSRDFYDTVPGLNDSNFVRPSGRYGIAPAELETLWKILTRAN